MSRALAAALMFAVSGSALVAPVAASPDFGPVMMELAEKRLKPLAAHPEVVEAVKEQNARTGSLSQAEIDNLDQQWRAETKTQSRPLIDTLLGHPLSTKLKAFKEEGAGSFTEIFVMDAKGLNVGQSDMTSDYWQGDEAKWQKTFLVGPEAVFLDEVKEDESTQTFQSQISLVVVDPDSNMPIGAVTVGVDVEKALQ